jgi:Protein of unknown function (DUF1579)
LASEKAEKFDPEMEEMMKKAEAACTPGPAHQALEPLVGEWDAEVKTWMDPGAFHNFKRSCEIPLGAKRPFRAAGVQRRIHGQPFYGIGLTAYDNVRQNTGASGLTT